MPTQERIYELLEAQRLLVIDKDTGGQVRSNAWACIDLLLDSLIDVERVEDVPQGL